MQSGVQDVVLERASIGQPVDQYAARRGVGDLGAAHNHATLSELMAANVDGAR
ncbi:hypothetical protein [Mycobacterium branderi]|uniref:Uncharacterized protein n=1 Tax=Mycobacterium branderi TaxID=43348 RepID=A0ABN6BCS3_9MYCO|nr:hypothetical protein [Mycobacterium branderi]MCV7231810.1 hypothetical protein [Mycobacterium branderi]BBZ15536.1 hypothetical protein MBRA_57310 [Mycobacterium branderi]